MSSASGRASESPLAGSTPSVNALYVALCLREWIEATTQGVVAWVCKAVIYAYDPTNGNTGVDSVTYEAFVKAGGKILACPHCAQAAGVDAKTLRSGAQIVKEEEFAAALLAADKILDY